MGLRGGDLYFRARRAELVIRHLRGLWRRRRVTLPAVAVLALGIGLSTAMWSVIDGVMLRGLPFPEGDRIVAVATRAGYDWPVSVTDFHALRDVPAFTDLAGFRTFNTVVTRPEGGSKGFTASYVTGNLFEMLGVAPVLGRSFTPADEATDAPAVVILSHQTWQGQFGGDPGVLGRTAIVNREPMTIIGVMAEGFRFPIRQEAWAALHWEGRSWSDSGLFAVGRLRPGLDAAGAQRELEPWIAALEAEHPLSEAEKAQALGVESRDIWVTDYVEAMLPRETQKALRVLLAGVLALLLVGCANAGHLRLADALTRSSELALRRALGAGLPTLLRQLLAESALVVGAGLVAGLALAALLVRLADTLLLQGSMLVRQFWIDVRLDSRAVVFACVAAAAALALGGLLPACWTLWRERFGIDPRSGSSPSRQRVVRGLVVLQIATSFALLLGAGLLVRTASSLVGEGPGFDSRRLSTTLVSSYQSERRSEAEYRGFWEQVLPALESSPEIESVGLFGVTPWLQGANESIRVDSQDVAVVEDLPRAAVIRALPGFLDVLGLPLLSGRSFEFADLVVRAQESPTLPTPALVSASFAERHWEGSPLEKRFEIHSRFGRREPTLAQVVGVVADRGTGRSDRPYSEDVVFTPYSFSAGGGWLITRGRGGDVLAAIDREITRVDPRMATIDHQSFDQSQAEASWVERRLSQLFSLYGLTALALATVGLYGMVALSVARRRRELGIRLALGAVPRDLRRRVLSEGVHTLLWGLAAGGLFAVLVAGSIRGFLYEVEPWDPIVLAGAGVALALGWLIATLGPATQAARTDPVESLRSE